MCSCSDRCSFIRPELGLLTRPVTAQYRPNLDKYVENPAMHVLYEIADGMSLTSKTTEVGLKRLLILKRARCSYGVFSGVVGQVWGWGVRGAAACGRTGCPSDDRRLLWYNPAVNSTIKIPRARADAILMGKNLLLNSVQSIIWIRRLLQWSSKVKNFILFLAFFWSWFIFHVFYYILRVIRLGEGGASKVNYLLKITL